MRTCEGRSHEAIRRVCAIRSPTDVDADMVARATERLALRGSGRGGQEDADGNFDFVLGLGVLHHVGEWERACARRRACSGQEAA